MMRKIAGTGSTAEDEMKYAAAAAAGFQRGLGGHPHGTPPNIPPNMIPENMIYNPKFVAAAMGSQQQQAGFNFSAPNVPNGGDTSHLHKMEGLLKPCFDDYHAGSAYGNFNPHHHHQYPGTQHMLEHAGSFVNNFKSDNNGGNILIKQESNAGDNNNYGGGGNNKTNDVLMYGRSSNGNNPNSSSSSSGSNLSSKEPNEFNLNYSGSAKVDAAPNDHGADDSIDKLSGLNDNDSEP